MYLGNGPARSFNLLKADLKTGEFIPAAIFDKQLRDQADVRSSAQKLAEIEKKLRETELQESQNLFLNTVAKSGQKICRELISTYDKPSTVVAYGQQAYTRFDGKTKLIGFVENESAG